MRKRTASGKAHPVGGNHFGVFPWVFVSLRRSFTSKKDGKARLFLMVRDKGLELGRVGWLW